VNAVDVTARGLASRVQTLIDATLEGAVNIGARDVPTAAALEALAAGAGAITGYAGATHTVETAPFLRRDDLVIRGNGATLRNLSASDWNSDSFDGATLPLGTSDLLASYRLTLDAVQSANGNAVTLSPGAASRYSPGDHFYCRGTTEHSYVADGATYHVPRFVRRGVILDVAGDVLILDRALPPDLMADQAKIATVAEGVNSAIAGQPLYYLLRPHVSALTLVSDNGEAIKMGGIIGGAIRDLHIEAINGMVLGAMERTLVENVTFVAHRKIAEIAEGSNGVMFRNFAGSVVAGPGGPAPVLMQIGENSSDCVMERFDVDGGPDIGPNRVACLLHSGRRNAMRDMTLDLRNQTGTLTALQSLSTEGNSCDDSGFSDVTVLGTSPLMFFALNDGGAGINRGFWRNVRFFGMPTQTVSAGTVRRAGWLGGNGTVYRNVWCEHGAAEIDPAATDITVRDCYFPDGFVGLTDSLFMANDIHDNDSDANRRLRKAARIVIGNAAQVTSMVPNNPYQAATFAGGDLRTGDRIFVYTEASAGGTGPSNRQARLSLTVNGVTTGIGSIVRTGNGNPMGYEAEWTILTDTGTTASIGYRINAGGTFFEGVINVASLLASSLTVTMEYWCGAAADPVNTRVCRIIPMKRGMKHLPLR
jgi:hypothetical protein